MIIHGRRGRTRSPTVLGRTELRGSQRICRGVHRQAYRADSPTSSRNQLCARIPSSLWRAVRTFDNAHGIKRPGGRFVKTSQTFDHWHRGQGDPGRPYSFTTAAQLLEDFWREVKRVMDERKIPNDL